ncbi:MAG: hypothetical protein ACRDHG_15560 [Anaerolineales bacterium]
MESKRRVVSVRYAGPIDRELDLLIRRGLEGMGLRWWAQGMNLETGVRDLAFAVPGGDG